MEVLMRNLRRGPVIGTDLGPDGRDRGCKTRVVQPGETGLFDPENPGVKLLVKAGALEVVELISAPATAEEWLRAFLSDGPKLASEVMAKGAEAGFNKQRLGKAKPRIGAESYKESRVQGRWFWRLV